MKGIVVEINHSEAVLLLDDGTFSKIKNEQYAVGQTIVFQKSRVKQIVAVVSAVAAAFCIVCAGFAYYMPTTYVSEDVNPSIAFSLNMFNRVLKVQPVNEDAEPILENMNLRHKTIDDALVQTINKFMDKGYLTNNETDDILIATSQVDGRSAENLANLLEEQTQEFLCKKGQSVLVEAQSVTQDYMQKAKVRGMTPGKLILLSELKESYENPNEFKIEDWINKPVRAIKKKIKSNQLVKCEKNESSDLSVPSEKPESNVTESYQGSSVVSEQNKKEENTVKAENPNNSNDSKSRNQQNTVNKNRNEKDNKNANANADCNGNCGNKNTRSNQETIETEPTKPDNQKPEYKSQSNSNGKLNQKKMKEHGKKNVKGK